MDSDMLILFGGIGIFIILVLIIARLLSKRFEKDDKALVEQVAQEIIEESNWQAKQRWIDKDTMEAVLAIFGKVPGERRVWARFQRSTNGTFVLIQYWHTATILEVRFVQEVAEYLKQKGYYTSVASTWVQPTNAELHPEEEPLMEEVDQDTD